MNSHAQTATEYLVILGVVIVIGLITVTTLTDITGLGGGIDEKTARLTLAAQTIAITEYAVSDYDTLLTLKNNYKNTVTIDTISVNGKECLFFYGTVHRLTSGQTKDIVCQNVYELDDSSVEYPIEINYTDYTTGASFSQSDSDLVLVGDVLDKYMLTLTSNDYWNSSIDGCYDNSTETGNQPICTCIDLNNIRYHLSTNFILQNSIDFNRCKDEFGVDYTSTGDGWSPIAQDGDAWGGSEFSGIFDGNYKVLSNLFVSSSTQESGFFGDSSNENTVLKNIGLANILVEGVSYTGGLTGNGYRSTISNVYFSGAVSGVSYVGGLVGNGYFSTISNSYGKGVVSGVSTVGGLVGFGQFTLSNSYFSGAVSGDSSVGGLIGIGAPVTVSNSFSLGTVNGSRVVGGLLGHSAGSTIISSYAKTKVFCTTELCGGLVGQNAGPNVFVNSNTFVTYSDDDAINCYGDWGSILAGGNITNTCYGVNP